MPYIRKTTRIKDKIYRTHMYSARYGDKTVPGPKKKHTKESVKKSQERERLKKLSWLIELNFEPGDWHVTLTFKKDCRTTDKKKINEIKKELFKQIRKVYRKEKQEFKYIVVVEKLKTCVHLHMIVNDVAGLSKMLPQTWKYGRVYMTPLFDAPCGFSQLASYLLKEVAAGERERGEQAYSRSRNLKMPETVTEVIRADRWLREPKAPKGFMLDKNSLYSGIDTRGYLYQTYRFIRLDKENDDGGIAKVL